MADASARSRFQFTLVHLIAFALCAALGLLIGKSIGQGDYAKMDEHLRRSGKSAEATMYWLQCEHELRSVTHGLSQMRHYNVLPRDVASRERIQKVLLHGQSMLGDASLDAELRGNVEKRMAAYAAFEKMNATQACAAFGSAPDLNFVAFYWLTLERPQLIDELLTQLHAGTPSARAADPFLAWNLGNLSHEQKKKYAEYLIRIDFRTEKAQLPATLPAEVVPHYLEHFLQITQKPGSHAERAFRVEFSDQTVLVMNGVPRKITVRMPVNNKPFEPVLLEPPPVGKHTCRFIVDGYLLAAENVGPTVRNDFHKIPFHKESPEFTLEVTGGAKEK